MDSIATVVRSGFSRFFVALSFLPLALVLLCAGAGTAAAHPLLRDRMEIAFHERMLKVTIRSSLRTVVTSIGREPLAGAFYAPAEVHRAVKDAVPYLLAHLRFEADGVALTPRVIAAELEKPVDAPIHRLADLEGVFANYRLELEADRPLAQLRVEHSMLEDMVASGKGGGRWVLDYSVEATDATGAQSTHLLRPSVPLDITTGARARRDGRGAVFLEYLALGARHIMGGFDHLLFLAAIVLGASSVRALVAVVASFTLAHTTTLALATVGLVAIPSRLVEPLIGLSIVIAAATAARSPATRADSIKLRAALAFGFGLVHGLGFAGGLVEALQGDRTRIALALVAFTLGVELVQQALVVPVYAAASWARARPFGPKWIERAALVVVVLGILFLIQALKRAT